MILLSTGAIINKILGLLKTLILIYFVGESSAYSSLLEYVYMVQLFLVPFDYSFLNTLFTGVKFEADAIRKLLIIAGFSLFILGCWVLYKGDNVYALMSITYFVLSLLSSFSIIALNRLRYLRLYLATSILSSCILLCSTLFVKYSIDALYIGRIFSVLPLIIALLIVGNKINLRFEKEEWKLFRRRSLSSLLMNKSTILMIILPIFLAAFDFNLTYYAYAMTLSGMVNTVIVRNVQLLTMSRISYSLNLYYFIVFAAILAIVMFMLPMERYLLNSFDLIVFMRYLFLNAFLLLLLGQSDIKLTRNAAS
jgi:hypothetical protein